MRVLLACEESQAVTIEFRRRGHEAYSCDVMPCSGGHPEWHIQKDVLKILNPTNDGEMEAISFWTMDDKIHIVEKWDLIIAFPPCTFLTAAGNRWFNVERYGEKALQRIEERKKAAAFFMQIANADCPKIVIENPVGVMSRLFRKPDQIIHPYYFAETDGDENCERKQTCLWLKGVNPLSYEIKFEPRVIQLKNRNKTDSPWHVNTIRLPKEERARLRSKTYSGVAKAMATQWG